ncbi:chaoptin-like [Frankliniella occidentalis]|uniref:Chaoptin-like n=1 Tax=Frankliniella occidentalis TaxID=133901 RepID=A0A9C6XUX7_FRAOC|nr:chaoptin-like [Frankliniella occidentalis]
MRDSLPSQCFNGTLAVRELRLDQNALRVRKEPAAVANLSRLHSLFVANNRLSEVPDDALPASLRALSISGNDLHFLPVGALRRCTQLAHLNAGYNGIPRLTDGDLEGPALRPLEKLRWLALDNNDIRVLSHDALRTLISLEFLNLEDNLLSELPPGLLGEEHSNLRELRLGYNMLRALRPEALRRLPALRTLVLAGNHIHMVESSALEDLPRLETVLLRDNKVSKLQPRSFVDLPSLSSLDLHRNRLQVFSLSAFVNVSRPEAPLTLNVSWNRVAELYSGGTEGAPLYVHTLDLSHNFIAELKSKFLVGVGATLRRLHLAHNRVSRLDGLLLGTLQSLELLSLEHNDLVSMAPRAFQGCDMLQVLLLAHNHVASLQPEQFAGMASLRVLDLSHNRLRAVPPGALSGTALERLDLSNNALGAVPSAALAEAGASLRSLGLASNAIQHLDGTVFLATPGLCHLDLADNRLSFLPDNVFSPLGALLSLRLGRNPLRANLAELFHYVHGLRELGLDAVGLRAAPPLPLPSLVALNLSGNSLQVAPQGELPALRSLHLAANMLGAPPDKPFPLLSTLDLSNNRIRALGRTSFSELPRLRSLALRSLPLEVMETDTLQPLRLLRVFEAEAWTGLGPQGLGKVLASAPSLKSLCLRDYSPQCNHALHTRCCRRIRGSTG